MPKLDTKQQKIVGLFLEKGEMQSSDVHNALSGQGEDISLVTVKRALSELESGGILTTAGLGRSTSYKISSVGRVFADIDAKQYCTIEPDKRYGLKQFNFDLLPAVPTNIIFEDEVNKLDEATVKYKERIKDSSAVIQKKELERLVIELSWKSSKLEGNTYTLLDTERLILENKKAEGHSKDEAQMILNHKDAFNYIHQNSAQFKTVSRKNIEELHTILVKDLGVGVGLRKKVVGVTGSIYHPLDNIHQISEAIESLANTVSRLATPYEKALVVLLGISYIQPFEDGNKRTARLMTNAILLAHKCAPLSYRSIDENDYREAMLVFYEINSLMPIKKIFIEQYLFAAENYAVR
ncbi:MAG: Fic family protein [bacterium]|nr:Fic family protein [bacterium]